MPACGRTPSPRWSRRARGASRAKAPEPECRSVEIDPDGRTLLMRSDCPGGRRQPGRPRPGRTPDLDDLKGQIGSRIAALSQEWAGVPGARPVTVLGVMVSAGPSPGAAETRRRYRYAALSALMLEEFLPDDAEHVGYADLAKGTSPQFVPYEWFTRLPQQRCRCREPGPGAPVAGRRQPGCPRATRRGAASPRRGTPPPGAPLRHC